MERTLIGLSDRRVGGIDFNVEYGVGRDEIQDLKGVRLLCKKTSIFLRNAPLTSRSHRHRYRQQ